ncbi:MAG: hypothetical protein J6T06_02885 [Victivallales bacterium]|nr:hypothetical protein [Victivallales bacterium]
MQNENPTANESNGSGGSAVVKALRATEKRMVKSLAKNKKTNYSSTEYTEKASHPFSMHNS